ncbi:MAG TPA: hypothetical protein VMW27_27195 [Thermoanaerobaculia bacterium]|nr:hypothetical protein [Thermoanaerobaculia bacterium]
MRPALRLLAAVLLVSCVACGREEEPAPAPAPKPAPRQDAAAAPPAADVESEVQRIETHCGEVLGQLSELRKVERDLKGLSTEGGTLQAWLDGKRPALFRATIYGETGRSEPEICFGKGGRLRRATIRESRYDRPLGKVVSTREDRLYFQGETLIRWIGPDGQPVPADRPEHGVKGKEVLELSQQLVEAAQEGKT